MEGTLDENSPIEEETRNGHQLKQESCTQYRKYERKEIYCPFTWNECCKSLKSPSLLVKLNEKLSTEGIPWHKFCYQMLLICIHIAKEEEEKALAAYESCEEILRNNKNENFFKEILVGLEHVLYSCKLFLFVENGDNEAARLIFSRIKSFQVLNQLCQASVLAVKTCILVLFGNKAQQEALKCIKAAIELDPDEMGIRKGAWYALAGRTHTEIRSNQGYNVMPSLEERCFLERSIQKNPFPENYLYLADTYRQIAKMLIQQSFKNNKEEAEELSKKTKKMYEDAISDETASVRVLNRAGMGLIKLSKQFRNVELAGIAFDKVLKIDPNNKGALIGMGHLMNWCMNDYKEALKYYEKASLNNPVGRYVIQMKSIIDMNYNPLEDCEKYIESEKDMLLGREETITYFYIVKAEYFFVKKDLMEAVHCWEKALESATSGKDIWEYQCLFMKEKRVKFSKIIIDEINLALKRNMDKSNVEYLRKILKLTNSSPLSTSNEGKK